MEIGVRKFQTGGVCKGPSMEPMQGVRVKEGVEEPGTADIAYHDDLALIKAHVLKGFVQRLEYSIMGATGTEHGGSIFV
jgi:hypothetical protein